MTADLTEAKTGASALNLKEAKRKNWIPASAGMTGGATNGRALVIGVYIVLALFFLFDPRGAFRRYALVDPDDAMRLAQVSDFLKGQSWFDVQPHRLIDGASHWARLADLPVAGVAALLSLGLPLINAIMAASLAVPLLLLGLLVPLVARMARGFAGRKDSGVAALLLLFAPQLLFQFMPARVDHHALQILIAGFCFATLPLTLFLRDAQKLAAMTGAVAGLGLWIGGEAAPFAALYALMLGLHAAWDGRSARNARVFGVSFSLSAALCLVLARPASEWMLREVTWFSLTYVLFAALTGAVLVGISMLPQGKPRLRLFLTALMGGTALGLLIYAVPDLARGPYANLDPIGGGYILDSVTEAESVWHKMQGAHGFAVFLQTCFVPLLALIYAVFMVWHKTERRRWLGISGVAYLGASLGLAFFWQARVLGFAQLFALPLAAGLWGEARTFFQRRLSPRSSLVAEISLLALLGIAPVMIAPALLTGGTMSLARFFAPVQRPDPAKCNPLPVMAFLNDADLFGPKPHRVLSTMDVGPFLLFFTQHETLAAPYNAPHNRDVFTFFRAKDPAVARQVLDETGADVVLFCRSIAPTYAGLDTRDKLARVMPIMARNGTLTFASDAKNISFIERLMRETPPEWLKKIEIPGASDYLLFAYTPEPSGLKK